MDQLKRISKDPEKRRSEFIEAAERLFTAKGYDETTISDIVKEVNVAQGTFYYYFGSKNEVLEAVIEKLLAILEDKARGILESQGSPEKKLRNIVNSIIEANASKKDLLNYLHEESNVVLHERLERRTIARMAPLIAELLSEGSKKGAFHLSHPTEASEFILAALVYFFHKPEIFSDPQKKERPRDTLEHILSGMLRLQRSKLSLAI